MLGSMTRATNIAGKPVIETRCAASGAIFNNNMSDRRLSDAARKCNDFLLGRDVVEAIVSFVTWTCLLEDVGAINSMILASHGGGFKRA